ncbi:MAG: tetratricopeptide repeat protein [Deltaproteobacteria bacterium]|nr:tetratricopeptide repeat protein [Deltaproteobacteria bacterium]
MAKNPWFDLSIIFLCILNYIFLCGCSTPSFVVKSDPLQADVFVQDPKSSDKKPIGKTPLQLPLTEVRKTLGNSVGPGEFFNVIIEKQGFLPQTYAVPATKFGTMIVQYDIKLKPGNAPKEVRIAKEILDHIFVAQKLALLQQFERAQIELDKVIIPFPNFARALSMRASIYFAQKNYVESLKWYEEAIKNDPELDDAIKMIAKIKTLNGSNAKGSNL